MTIDHDAQLMLSVKDGDRKAFQELFRRHAGSLNHFVCRFVGNPSVAEELVQEIFFKIYRAAHSYEPRGRFTTYLYRVATNHCLNEVRRADYRERFDSIEQSIEDKDRPAIDLPNTNEAGAEEHLWGHRLAEQLHLFLLDLPENQRAALLLNRLEDLSYQEIADVLAVSVGAVKSLLHRARNTLRKRLEVWNEESSRI